MNNPIRAADFLPKESNGDPESFQMAGSDTILYGLFGDTPDYSNPKIEAIWQEVLNGDDNETIAWCLEKGVDLLDKDGKPVPGFRDVAVMLKVREQGIGIRG